MNQLPKWLLANPIPAIHDFESLTVLEQTARLYGAMNALIKEYNAFAETVSKQLSSFTETEKKTREEFELDIKKLFRQFVCNIEEKQNAAARIAEVFLPAANWTGAENLYSQEVQIDGVSDHTQVDLTPSVEQLAVFYNKSVAFVAENREGTVTVYAIGDKPQNDYTIQVTLMEVI